MDVRELPTMRNLEFAFLRTSHPFLDGCPLLLLGIEISVHLYMTETLVALSWYGDANS